MVTVLPRPIKLDYLDMWVDESIWGHRLYDEQTPWMCMLEFMNVLESELKNNRAFIESVFNTLQYSPRSALYLRNILFNNPRMLAILQESQDNEYRWNRWFEVMAESTSNTGLPASNFQYLKDRFIEFSAFAKVVDFLRSTAIEGNSNKRWSSKFVFPYGPSCLYEDLNVKGGGQHTNDRRFFARTGEILYLMLARSGEGTELLSYLKPLILDSNAKWNRLVATLQPKDDIAVSTRSGGYLPHERLDDYKNLADDWLNILRCRMPGYDALPHLASLAGLHLIIYFLNRSREVLELSGSASFVLEIVSPKKTTIRDIAASSFIENNSLSIQAIEAHIQHLATTEKWQDAKQSGDPRSAAVFLLGFNFAWPGKDKDKNDEIAGIGSPDELLNKLIQAALARHKQHVGKFHATWGKEIGLSSRRGSTRSRYVPTDALLKTLVLCTVDSRMEFQEFLSQLHRKYGFIIGDRQAKDLIASGNADKKAFFDNANRLEQRLASIGLLKRLSDACAYVENPFFAGVSR
jgi:hypothetical protein